MKYNLNHYEVSDLLLSRTTHFYASNQHEIPFHTETKIKVKVKRPAKNKMTRNCTCLVKKHDAPYLVTQHNRSLIKFSRTEIMGPSKHNKCVKNLKYNYKYKQQKVIGKCSDKQT